MRGKSFRTILFTVIFVASGVAGFHFGGSLLFSDQWPVFDGLRQTAAIVFGLSGAYIAIVYPAALIALLKRQQMEPNEVAAFRHLLTSMELSFGVLVAVLVAGFCAPIVRHNAWSIQHAQIIRSVSFAFVAILTVVQLIAIVFILRPLDSFTRDVEHGRAARRIINSTIESPEEDDDEDH
jgi:hypothetical protein